MLAFMVGTVLIFCLCLRVVGWSAALDYVQCCTLLLVQFIQCISVYINQYLLRCDLAFAEQVIAGWDDSLNLVLEQGEAMVDPAETLVY